MIEAETLKSIATQLMTSTSVSVEGKSIPVRHTSRQHLRTAAFTVGGHEYQAIDRTRRSQADGGNWRGVVIRSCNSRTQKITSSWRLRWMVKLRFTVPARRVPEEPITHPASLENPKLGNASPPVGERSFAQMPRHLGYGRHLNAVEQPVLAKSS